MRGLTDAELARAAYVEVLDGAGQLLASSECFCERQGLHIAGLPADLYGVAYLRILDTGRALLGTVPARRDGLH